MDISHAAPAPASAPATATTPTPTGATPKSPEADPETPTRIQPGKPIPFSNGVLKRHHVNHHHSTVVTYKECLKNHAAGLGGHALDGCGEFMPDPNSSPSDPTSLKCAACGCHRNFHRRDPDDSPPTAVNSSRMIEFQPHHRHHPPPPHPPPPPPPPPHHRRRSSPDSSSPPPISSSYYPSAPHMLLALSTPPLDHAAAPPSTEAVIFQNPSSNTNSRKRFRTKFSPYQKQRMLEFAERVGWKMLKREDETVILDFCNEIGVERNVLKVWMHNNKSTLGKKESVNGGDGDGDGKDDNNYKEADDDNDNNIDVVRNTNASSSSS